MMAHIISSLNNPNNFSSLLKNESQGHALHACVYIYIRKHNLLLSIECCNRPL